MKIQSSSIFKKVTEYYKIMVCRKCNAYVIMDIDFLDFHQDDESPPPL